MMKLLALLLACASIAHGQYHSQCGQDKFINAFLFKNKKNGVFVDIGAHDGISFSNTYFYEKELNWTGLCIEPMPEVFAKLKEQRKCLCICGCIHKEHNVTKDFMRIKGPLEMLSGLTEKMDLKHLTVIKRGIAAQGGSYKIIPVHCYNLNKLLEQAKIKHVNFLSLDTEGGELDILKSIDFSKIQIDAITVEDNYGNKEIKTFLASKGFIFIRSLAQDQIFVHNSVMRKY